MMMYNITLYCIISYHIISYNILLYYIMKPRSAGALRVLGALPGDPRRRARRRIIFNVKYFNVISNIYI